MKRILLTFFCLLLTYCLFADDLLKGNIEFYYANDIKNEKQLRRAIVIDAEINKAFNDTEIKAIFRAEDDSARISDSSRIYLKEAYINQDLFFDTFITSLNLKAGKIIWTWGNADEIKPVDVLNPQDYSFLLFKLLNDRKYGLFGGEATVYFGENFNIQFITINEFKPSETESTIFEFSQLKKIRETPGFILNDAEMPDYSVVSNMPYGVRTGINIYDIDNIFSSLCVLDAYNKNSFSILYFYSSIIKSQINPFSYIIFLIHTIKLHWSFPKNFYICNNSKIMLYLIICLS